MRTVTVIIFSVGIALVSPALAQNDTKPLKKIDLSTPKPGERGKYGGGERTHRTNNQTFGTMDLGSSGQLRFDGSRTNSKDVVHEATGFDQTPGSTSFRSLTPAAKSGTPHYLGLTLTKPMTE